MRLTSPISKFFTLLILGLASISGIGAESKPNTGYRLIVFEGSDWCNICKRLDLKILQDEKFQDYLEENSIEIEAIDFPQRKKLDKAQKQYNKDIADKYDFQGQFPTLIIANADGSQYQQISFVNQSVSEMISEINKSIRSLQ